MPLRAFRVLISHHLQPFGLQDRSLSHLLCNDHLSTLSRNHLLIPKSLKSSLFWSIINRSLSIVPQIDHRILHDCNEDHGNEGESRRMPLTLFFKQAMGLSERNEDYENEIGQSECENEIVELKKNLRILEVEVRRSKEISKNRVQLPLKLVEREPMDSLYAFCKSHNISDNKSPKEGVNRICSLFANAQSFDQHKVNGVSKIDDEKKGLSEDMIVFVKHLFKKGYMDDANFLRNKIFDASSFNNGYGKKFLKDAAEKFGKDNQEIAKWLSGSALKRVALFGCPSVVEKIVLSSKNLRAFFRIEENTVCERCALKETCEFRDKKAADSDIHNLALVDVIKVIMLYDLKSTPPELVISTDVKNSVRLLLKEIVVLSEALN